MTLAPGELDKLGTIEFYTGAAKAKSEVVEMGGPGSGHWRHAGRKGKRGGSAPSKGRGLAWLEARGVRVHTDSPKNLTSEDISNVEKEVRKMPNKMIDEIDQAGLGMDLVADSGVTAHPGWVELRGVTPRGWEGTGKTWDDVPGAGASRSLGKTVIVANRLKEGHGSRNAIIHEHAHTFERAHYILTGRKFSQSAKWTRLHGSIAWKSTYQKRYAEEAFAESLAVYLDSPESRQTLSSEIQSYFKEILR